MRHQVMKPPRMSLFEKMIEFMDDDTLDAGAIFCDQIESEA